MYIYPQQNLTNTVISFRLLCLYYYGIDENIGQML